MFASRSISVSMCSCSSPGRSSTWQMGQTGAWLSYRDIFFLPEKNKKSIKKNYPNFFQYFLLSPKKFSKYSGYDHKNNCHCAIGRQWQNLQATTKSFENCRRGHECRRRKSAAAGSLAYRWIATALIGRCVQTAIVHKKLHQAVW